MKNISKDITTGEYKKVYLLYGDEDYLKKNIKNQLKKAIAGDETTMNYNYFEGKNFKISEVIAIADTFPFFADRRLIILENTGVFKSGDGELTEYISSMPDTTIMVFVESEVDKRGRLFKKVKDEGYVCELAYQGEAALTKWVLTSLGNAGKRITKETMELFLEYTGMDMSNIANEMGKLIDYTGESDVVTNADVEAICTPQVSGKIFDMIDAIGNKNSVKALSLYRNLLATKEPPMRILFMLTRQFNIMLKVKELGSKGYSNEAIAKNVGIQSFVAGKALRQAGGFSTRQLVNAIEDFVSTEEDVKNGRLDELAAVEMLIIKYSGK